MKRHFLIATAGLFLLLCTAVSFAQYGPNLTDRTYVAYRLSADQEAQFNVADPAVSPFWGKVVGCAAMDYIYVSPSNNGVGDVFTGEDDAQLTVYIAYGDSGIYFYFKVEDNNWVDYQVDCGGNPFGCTGDWANDAIDFGMEPTPPDQLTAAMCPTNNGWTHTCAQYQLRFGGAETPTFLRYNYWDQTSTTDAILWQGFTFADAASQFGILNKIVPTASSNVRVQEWRIPWRAVGNPTQSPVGACPSVGGKISGYFGYNDVDADATSQAGLKELRSGVGDLMNCAVRLADGRLDSWSTILFGPQVDAQAASATPPCEQVSVRGPYYMNHVANAQIVRSEYYSLNGQRLVVRNGKPIASPHSLVIERKIDVNGVIYPHLIVTK